MKINKETTVALVGYGTHSLMQSIDRLDQIDLIVEKTYEQVISLFLEKYDTFLVGMTMGFDYIAANAVLTAKERYHDIILGVFIPFENHELMFSPSEQESYREIVWQADRVSVLSENKLHKMYTERNDMIIENSSAIICYYTDGCEITKSLIEKAEKAKKLIINIAEMI